jgi:DeoR/GlpR family transcriptional regulator of sugar metabolism
LTMSSLEEIPIKRAAMAQSDRVIMVVDASKFGKPSLISMIPLTNVHTLVTDATPPEAAATVLRNLGVEVITPQD